MSNHLQKYVKRYNEVMSILKTANDFKVSDNIREGCIIMKLSYRSMPEVLGRVVKVSTNKSVISYKEFEEIVNFKTNKNLKDSVKRISAGDNQLIVLESERYTPHLWCAFAFGRVILDDITKEMQTNFSTSLGTGLIINPLEYLQSSLTSIAGN